MSCWAKLGINSNEYTQEHILAHKEIIGTKDNVNNPHHYNHKGVECINAIEAALSEEEFGGYLKGNSLKYVWREDHKHNPLYSLQEEVNSPEHYKRKSLECIEAIKAALTPIEFRGYLKGNIIKYTWREKDKGQLKDIKKAVWYITRLITESAHHCGLEDLKKAQWYLNKLIATWENKDA